MSGAEVEIRALQPRDLDALVQLLGLSIQYARRRAAELADGKTTAYVAERDGAVVGTVGLDERPGSGEVMHLSALAVAEEWQGRGIGTALIEAVEAETRERGRNRVCLGVADDNHGARRLYERLGYRQQGEPQISRWMWQGAGGELREVVENVITMCKRVDVPVDADGARG